MATSLLALTGCATPAPLPSNVDPVFAAMYERALDGGASDIQLDILRRAAELGRVTYQDVSESLAETFACFDSAGVGHEDMGVTILASGLPFPMYGWGGGISDDDVARFEALGDDCLNKNSYYVETLYQTQPIAVEGEARAFEERVPSMLSCLESLGVIVDGGAARADIEAAVSNAVVELTRGGTQQSPQADAIIGCLAPLS